MVKHPLLHLKVATLGSRKRAVWHSSSMSSLEQVAATLMIGLALSPIQTAVCAAPWLLHLHHFAVPPAASWFIGRFITVIAHIFFKMLKAVYVRLSHFILAWKVVWMLYVNSSNKESEKVWLFKLPRVLRNYQRVIFKLLQAFWKKGVYKSIKSYPELKYRQLTSRVGAWF